MRLVIRLKVIHTPKIDKKTTVNASVWTGWNPEGFLIHIISAMNYTKRTKLFKEWTSSKSVKEWHFKDRNDVENHLDHLIKDQKKASAETTTATKNN